jgi:hypothetical protein
MRADHIVNNLVTQRMECQHCGFSEAIKTPAPVDAILGKMDAFLEAHKDCKKPQAEAVMSDYIKGFDAGYSYVLNEIEYYIDVYPDDVFAVKELLAHLKMEGKPQ